MQIPCLRCCRGENQSSKPGGHAEGYGRAFKPLARALESRGRRRNVLHTLRLPRRRPVPWGGACGERNKSTACGEGQVCRDGRCWGCSTSADCTNGLACVYIRALETPSRTTSAHFARVWWAQPTPAPVVDTGRLARAKSRRDHFGRGHGGVDAGAVEGGAGDVDAQRL